MTDPSTGRDARTHLDSLVADIDDGLDAATRAREAALPACRRAIRHAGSSIRAVHRLDAAEAATLADACEVALREARAVLAPFPALAQAGYLHDRGHRAPFRSNVFVSCARAAPPGRSR